MAQCQDFLDRAVIPLRLSTLNASGAPLVTSLWFVRQGDALLCASVDDAKLIQRLRADPRCGFEVARDTPPYRGVRGQAVAQLRPELGREVLDSLIARYLGEQQCALRDFLLSRAHRELAIVLEPTWLRSWDYSARMADLPTPA